MESWPGRAETPGGTGPGAEKLGEGGGTCRGLFIQLGRDEHIDGAAVPSYKAEPLRGSYRQLSLVLGMKSASYFDFLLVSSLLTTNEKLGDPFSV